MPGPGGEEVLRQITADWSGWQLANRWALWSDAVPLPISVLVATLVFLLVPIIALYVGAVLSELDFWDQTEGAAKAILVSDDALAGSDAVYEAAFRRAVPLSNRPANALE